MADMARYDEPVQPRDSVRNSRGMFFNSTMCIGAVRTGYNYDY